MKSQVWGLARAALVLLIVTCHSALVTASNAGGGLGLGFNEIVGVWDTTKGALWIGLSTGLVHNGLTDASGESSGTATDRWRAPPDL
jgi:hypothetical protein